MIGHFLTHAVAVVVLHLLFEYFTNFLVIDIYFPINDDKRITCCRYGPALRLRFIYYSSCIMPLKSLPIPWVQASVDDVQRIVKRIDARVVSRAACSQVHTKSWATFPFIESYSNPNPNPNLTPESSDAYRHQRLTRATSSACDRRWKILYVILLAAKWTLRVCPPVFAKYSHSNNLFARA